MVVGSSLSLVLSLPNCGMYTCTDLQSTGSQTILRAVGCKALHTDTFHLFPQLPLDVRWKIWEESFEPRTIEIHGRKAHYADDFRHGSLPKWQSRSSNPAALSVNSEARAVARRCFTLRIPLARETSCENPGDSVIDQARVLYLNPAVDAVAVLGDLDFYRLSLFLSDLRHRDPAGEGLKRLAVSSRWTTHGGAGDSIRMIVRTMFPELVEFIVFLFDSDLPPTTWVNGTCALSDCQDKEFYKDFAAGGGRHLMDGNEWMDMGRSRLKVMQLNFVPGW